MNFQDRILILDGAMGTMIQRYSPTPDGNNDRLNIDAPDVIARIHREYIEAGADIIETNTFSSNRISQNEYGLSDMAGRMAFAGAEIARKVADSYSAQGRKIHVLGSVGPTSKSLSLSPDVENPAFRQYGFDDIAEAYKEQIAALVRGGVDAVLIETCFDALNVKAALYAVSELFPEKDFPVMISLGIGSPQDLSKLRGCRGKAPPTQQSQRFPSIYSAQAEHRCFAKSRPLVTGRKRRHSDAVYPAGLALMKHIRRRSTMLPSLYGLTHPVRPALFETCHSPCGCSYLPYSQTGSAHFLCDDGQCGSVPRG